MFYFIILFYFTLARKTVRESSDPWDLWSGDFAAGTVWPWAGWDAAGSWQLTWTICTSVCVLSADWRLPGHFQCPHCWKLAQSPSREIAGMTCQEPVTVWRAAVRGKGSCWSPQKGDVLGHMIAQEGQTLLQRPSEWRCPQGAIYASPTTLLASVVGNFEFQGCAVSVRKIKETDDLCPPPLTFQVPVLRHFEHVYPLYVTFLFISISTHHIHISFALSQTTGTNNLQ